MTTDGEIANWIEPERVVTVTYTNDRGETASRRIVPDRIAWGCSPWHPDWQWLLHCYDLEKQAHRTFALKQISKWEAFHAATDI